MSARSAVSSRTADGARRISYRIWLDYSQNGSLLGVFALRAIRGTRHLRILLIMGLFVFFFGFVAGMGAYWAIAGLRAVP